MLKSWTQSNLHWSILQHRHGDLKRLCCRGNPLLGAGPALLFVWPSHEKGCPSFPSVGKLGTTDPAVFESANATESQREGEYRLCLSAQEFLERFDVGVGEVGVAFGAHAVAASDGVLRLGHVALDALWTLCDVAAESQPVTSLLGAQAVEAAVHGTRAGGDLVDLTLQRIQIDGRRSVRVRRGLRSRVGFGRVRRSCFLGSCGCGRWGLDSRLRRSVGCGRGSLRRGLHCWSSTLSRRGSGGRG